MTARTAKQHRKSAPSRKSLASHQPAATAPVRQAAAPATPRRSETETAEARHISTAPARPSRRTNRQKRSEGSSEWIKAVLLLAGFVVAVIVAVHFIGGSSTPSSSTPGNGNQLQGPPGGAGNGSQPIVITPSSGG
jgi:hypothetical protein